jgi:putative hydrolase of the HAD superfamily
VFALPEHAPKVKIIDGTEQGLNQLQQCGYLLGVLSNGSAKSLQRDLEHLFNYFTFKVTEAKKPDPSLFLIALEKVGIPPRETIYVGDAVSDIALAKRVLPYFYLATNSY